MLLCLLLFSITSFCTALEWFISPPEDDGGVSNDFTQIHARLEGSLSDKVLSKSDIKVDKGKATSEEGRGGREPKQFKLPSFSSLIKSDTRLAPSGTFCEFFIFKEKKLGKNVFVLFLKKSNYFRTIFLVILLEVC